MKSEPGGARQNRTLPSTVSREGSQLAWPPCQIQVQAAPCPAATRRASLSILFHELKFAPVGPKAWFKIIIVLRETISINLEKIQDDPGCSLCRKQIRTEVKENFPSI